MKKLKALFTDTLGLVGIGGVSYGAWLYAQPLGFIVGGAFLITLAVVTTIENRPPT
jgi:hypothetical protein